MSGLLQQQQNASAPQTLSNRIRLMFQDLKQGLSNKGELLDRVYTKSGCVVSLDGSKVFTIHFVGGWA